MSTGSLAIETVGLGKRYGSTWALQDCSLTLPSGHVTALVGPNGAGKTSLLKLLVGLSTPTTGEAKVLGRVPQQDAAAKAPTVAMTWKCSFDRYHGCECGVRNFPEVLDLK